MNNVGNLIAENMVRHWQERGLTPEQACARIGVVHSRSWAVVLHHVRQANSAIESAAVPEVLE
jgi:hypothetical protein